MKIFITRPIPGQFNNLLTDKNYELDVYEKDEVCPREILLERIKNSDAVLTQWEDYVDKEFFDAAGDNLKIVANFGTGVDRIDLNEAARRNIVVTDTPTDSVFLATAEGAVALLASVAKRVTKLYAKLLKNDLPEYSPIGEMGLSLRNKTTGIVALGNIGSKVAAMMAKGFNNKILYISRTHKEALEKELPTKKVELTELFSQSDFIFITIPYTPQTAKIVSSELLNSMKPTAILVSVSPAEVIDEQALLSLLTQKKIYGAALDISQNISRPLETDNVILTSHMINMESDVTLEMTRICLQNIANVLSGQKPLSPVTKH
ncbi:D-glycerate dehydrogenase [Candidatus Roizmanbacteria bacterium]|nr:D-glycerate dehydrogenase [Candidatus Roizmanbacteria bacterium]